MLVVLAFKQTKIRTPSAIGIICLNLCFALHVENPADGTLPVHHSFSPHTLLLLLLLFTAASIAHISL